MGEVGAFFQTLFCASEPPTSEDEGNSSRPSPPPLGEAGIICCDFNPDETPGRTRATMDGGDEQNVLEKQLRSGQQLAVRVACFFALFPIVVVVIVVRSVGNCLCRELLHPKRAVQRCEPSVRCTRSPELTVYSPAARRARDLSSFSSRAAENRDHPDRAVVVV